MYSSIATISLIAVTQALNLEYGGGKGSAMKMREPRGRWGYDAYAEDMMEDGECEMDMEMDMEECDMDMGMEYDLDDGIVEVDEEPMYEHEYGWMRDGWRGRDSHPRHGAWEGGALVDGIVEVEEEPMHQYGWMREGHKGNGWRGRAYWAPEEGVSLDDGIVEVDEEPMHEHMYGWNRSGHKGRGRRSW